VIVNPAVQAIAMTADPVAPVALVIAADHVLPGETAAGAVAETAAEVAVVEVGPLAEEDKITFNTPLL